MVFSKHALRLIRSIYIMQVWYFRETDGNKQNNAQKHQGTRDTTERGKATPPHSPYRTIWSGRAAYSRQRYRDKTWMFDDQTQKRDNWT